MQGNKNSKTIGESRSNSFPILKNGEKMKKVFQVCLCLLLVFILFQLSFKILILESTTYSLKVQCFELNKSLAELENEVAESSATVKKCGNATFMVCSPFTGGVFGSAVLIDKEHGILLTAAHVVEDNPKFVLFDGVKIPILTTAGSTDVDLGIISIDFHLIAKLKCVSLPLNEYNLPLGTACFACGYPALLEGGMTITSGRFLSKQVAFQQTVYQLSMNVHEGMSGGPIVDLHGNIVGISCYTIGTNLLGSISIPGGYAGCVPVNENIDTIHLLLQEIGDGK